MMLLTNEQRKWYEITKSCYICKQVFEDKHSEDKKHRKVRDHCHYTGEYGGDVHSICNLNFSTTEEIPKILILDLTMNIILS